MSSIRKEISIERSQPFVWHRVRDVGNIHKRLVPGFVTDCVLEDGARIVTFANGLVLRELIVDVDDTTCRHSWATHDKPFIHYNASAQVLAGGPDTSRVVWTADFLPNELKSTLEETIQQGLNTMKQTLERA